MKLIKCRKCGATVMTAETMLSTMQDEYNDIVKKSRYAKGADKQICAQQMKHLSKLMIAVCHSSSEAECHKQDIYNEFLILRKYVTEHNLIDYRTLDAMRDEARELTKKKAAEDEKALERIYGDYENYFCNRTKADPTAKAAIDGHKNKR